MATIEQLSAALVKAHDAGNTADAQVFANALRELKAQQGGTPSSPAVKLTGTPIPGGMTKFGEASSNMEWAQGQEPRPTMADEAMSFGRGAIEGVPILGPTLSDWQKGASSNIASLLGGGDAETLKAIIQRDDDVLRSRTGGARFAGNVAGSVAALAPLGMTAVGGRVLGMTGTVGQRIVAGSASSAVISGADTAARGGSFDDIVRNSALGAGLGAVLPALGAVGRRVISPSPASAAKTNSSNVLRHEGVDLTAGQSTGNRNLQFREAGLGGTAAQNFMEQQADQFTAAALRRVGVNAPRATHDVIDATDTAIGQQFDDISARNFIQPDTALARDLQGAWRRFEGSTNPSTRPRVIERIIQDIYGRAQGQRIPGEWYKSTRSELGRLGKSQNSDLSEAARDVQHALDDVMERTIRQFNPADHGAWQEVRRLYRNMLVITDAATRAGAASAEGIITPQALRSAAIRHNKRAFSRGRSDFTELADAGVSAMTPLQDSGTQSWINARSVLPIGAGTGAGLGGVVGGIPGAVVGGVVGAAAPWALGRAILSRPGRAYLGNQVAAGAGRAFLPPALLPLGVASNERGN